MLKSKSQQARLLSYGQSISTPIAMTIAVLAGANILSVLSYLAPGNFNVNSVTKCERAHSFNV